MLFRSVTLTLPGNPIVPSGLFANTDFASNGGSITISAGSVSVTGGAEISSSTRGSGSGGAIQILSAGGVSVSGQGLFTKPVTLELVPKSSGIVANTFSTGNAGTISITAPAISILNEGRIQTKTEASGAGGNIELTVGSLFLSGRGQISTDAGSSIPGEIGRAHV